MNRSARYYTNVFSYTPEHHGWLQSVHGSVGYSPNPLSRCRVIPLVVRYTFRLTIRLL